jgi:hypothetical protein
VKQADLDSRFDHHAPDAVKAQLHQLIRNVFKDSAEVVAHELPECREKSLAITKLEEAMMWANAAISRNDMTLAPNSRIGHV